MTHSSLRANILPYLCTTASSSLVNPKETGFRFKRFRSKSQLFHLSVITSQTLNVESGCKTSSNFKCGNSFNNNNRYDILLTKTSEDQMRQYI